MSSPARVRPFFLLSCLTAVGIAVGPLAERVLERRFADPRWLKLEAAMEGEEGEREGREGPGPRFDQPSEALAFYVNSRTGPIITRGPDVTTGVRTLDPSRYLPALRQMRAMPRFSSATGAAMPSFDDLPDAPAASPGAALTTWSNLGPSNQGGRTRALLIDPGNPNVMYAGGVAGGVWKSTDAGANWTALAQLQMANLAVVTLAFQPGNSNTIYAGTGEGFFNADAIRGAGIFRSTDAGVTWSQLTATNTSDFHYVSSLIVSPRNTQRLWAATRTGLFRSIDGGASWTQLVNGSAVNGCTQVALQLTGASGFVFGACGNFAQGTVYRADDTDASTFASVLSNAGMGRSSIAVAPSNTAVVYVMSASRTTGGPGTDGLHAIYRSAANGDSGSFVTQFDAKASAVTDQQRINQLLLSNPVFGLLATCFGGSSQFLNQGWYDNVLAVDPLDENRVWAGGIDLFRSDDGGANWGVASYWWFTKGADPEYHHADQHGLVFHPGYNGTSNRIMFATSDGGVERVDDARAPVGNTLAAVCGTPVVGSPTWVDRNNGYVTTQFYDGSVYPDGGTFFGGLQDNGTQRGTTGGSTWSVLAGGDGGYTAVDTLGDGNAGNDVLFLENTGLSIQRSLNGGSTFTDAITGITGDGGFPFISTFVMNQGNKQQLWTGGWYAWRTTNRAGAWSRASAILPGNGSVSAIAAHPLDGNRVLYGMTDGYIAYSTAALSATSATAWSSSRPATSSISWLAWDPANTSVAYATVSAFGVNNLYKSVDGGATWTPSVGSGPTALPQIPARSVVVHPADSLQVFVGTDLGVFTSVDGGASWYLENTGFANVSVEALKFNETAPYQLYAFTHGRGAWRVALNTASPSAPVAVADSYATPFNTQLTVAAPGVLGNDNANGGGTMTAVLDTTTASGTLVLNANGGFTFTPTTGFTGNASFTYHVTNTNGSSNVVTVAIAVNGLPPTTTADSYTTPFNTVLTVAAPGVLANDTANGGASLTASLQTAVAHGTLALNANGGFTYTPTTGYSGADSFTYRAVNSAGPGNTVTVSLTVNPAPPVGPQPPSNFRITGMSGTTVSMAWTLPTSGPAVIALQLEGGPTPGSVIGALPLGATPAVTVALPTGSFFIRLRSITASGVSGPSNEIVANINVPVAPSAPSNLLGLVNGSALALAWTPTFGGGAPAGALLDVTGPVVATLPLGPAETFTYPAVPPGTYTFSVRQTNAAGSSGGSNAITLTFPGACSGAPQTPRNFAAFNASGVLNVIWDPPASGPAPTAYTIVVGGSYVGALPMTMRSFTIPPPPGTYTFAVTASNACGTSAPTATQTVSFP